MKKRMWVLLGSLFIVLATFSSVAVADVLRVAPSQAAVLPSEGDGWTRVALQFDLSGMRAGAGRQVVWAYLEWSVTGAGTDEKEFLAYPVTAAWTAGQVMSPGSISYSEAPVSDWTLTTEEQEKLGCAVRLDMKSLASDWLTGVATNYGIVMATREVAGHTLADQLQNAQLVVGYGFFGAD